MARAQKKRSTGQTLNVFVPPSIGTPTARSENSRKDKAVPEKTSTAPNERPEISVGQPNQTAKVDGDTPRPPEKPDSRPKAAAKNSAAAKDYEARVREARETANQNTRRRGRPRKDSLALSLNVTTSMRADVRRKLNDRIAAFNESQLVDVPAAYFFEAAVRLLLEADEHVVTRVLKQVQDSRYA